MSDSICAYCGKSMDDDDPSNVVIDDGREFHQDCYEQYRLDEVTDAYNKEGVAGLKKIEQADDLDASLGLS